MKLCGNSDKFNLENIKPNKTNLNYKHIYFLGSSVTYGAASGGVSFVEYLSKRNEIYSVKEAVSGTTLCDNDGTSYVSRLKNNPGPYENYDMFISQLSTNDATKKLPLGEIGNNDTKTVIGAIEYIINYVKEKWNCPVVFYTGSYYDSKEYALMVSALYRLKEKYDIGIIDMFNDKDFNNIRKSLYHYYMHDSIHPYKSGYLLWWTPYMEKYLLDNYFKK